MQKSLWFFIFAVAAAVNAICRILIFSLSYLFFFFWAAKLFEQISVRNTFMQCIKVSIEQKNEYFIFQSYSNVYNMAWHTGMGNRHLSVASLLASQLAINADWLSATQSTRRVVIKLLLHSIYPHISFSFFAFYDQLIHLTLWILFLERLETVVVI